MYYTDLVKRKVFFVFLLVLVFVGCNSAHKIVDVPQPERVVLGDERFDLYLPMLSGKKVALFSNHSGIVGDKIILSDGTMQYGGFSDPDIPFGFDAVGSPVQYGDHILDALISRGVNVTAIFSPEHGFRGTAGAGENVSNSVDEKTGVPILSLYGNDTTSGPSNADMAKFDTLVVDLQDVGLRYYTYYIALYHLLDSCAAAGKNVIVLDRPNPNGFYVDGEILKDEFRSGVGALPIPTVHGLTFGELARMMNGEGWLSSGKNACDLTVIPCKNYSHQTAYSLVRAPSPNIKTMRAVYLYASTCFFENTIVSVARGTQFPFEVYGSPYFGGIAGYDFSFVPKSIPGAENPPFLEKTCWGVDLRTKPVSDIMKEGINVSYLLDAYQAALSKGEDGSFFGSERRRGQYWIDLLSGSSTLRTSVISGKDAKSIKDGWRNDIESFKKQRKPYLLYSEEKLPSQWQLDVSFPDWMNNTNFSANNALSFCSFHGQGKAIVTVSENCSSFSLYINDSRVATKSLAGGKTYEIDISKYTKDGLNVLQVSDILPAGLKNAVRVCVGYPVVEGGALSESNISKSAVELIDKIISADIEQGFTSAQLAIVKDGRLVYENAWGEGITTNTLYDLASVTKMFSANYAVQYLVSQNMLSLETKIVDILGDEFADNTISIDFKINDVFPLETIKEWKRAMTVRDIITHTAGFAPIHAYYNDTADIAAGTFNVGKGKNPLLSGSDSSEETRRRTLEQIFRTPLVYEPHTRLSYSDIDFMLLCFVVEKVSGMRLDRFLKSTFFEPLSLSRITYRPLDNGFAPSDCAPTDPTGNSRVGKISFTNVRTGELRGQVHDENAYYAMAGISGHAGLFSTAADLARLASVMLTGGWDNTRLFSQNVMDTFRAPQNVPFADYGLGWWRSGEYQTPRHFGTVCSSDAYGHQGFTGTLAFIEPEENLVIVYLTNKINSPMMSGLELANQYTANVYQSAVVGFVPQIVLMGLDKSPSRAQWKSFVHGMVDDARKKAENEAADDKSDTRWKALAALENVYNGL